MKRIISVILAAMMLVCFAACGAKDGKGDASEGMETAYMTIEGVCVDDSYTDKNDASIKLVYIFYTFNANETNSKIDSAYTKMTINDTNSYESELYGTANAFAPNYYYSKYIEDVSMGNSLKVVATFKVPEADLAAGRTITLSDTQIPEIENIKFSTDVIQHFNSDEEIAKAMDPDGYASIMEMREPADAETVEKVKSCMNDYYWTFYCNSTYYKLEFSAPNDFYVVATIAGSSIDNGGTYEVLKGYIACTYPSNNNTIYIPWSFNESNELELDCTEAFDVN